MMIMAPPPKIKKHRIARLLSIIVSLALMIGGVFIGLPIFSASAVNYGTVCPITEPAPNTTPPEGSAVGCTIFPASFVPSTITSNDGNAVEVGIRFTVDVPGVIRGIRFYKSPTNVVAGGFHTVTLWNADQRKVIASHTLTAETPTGWQQGDFELPVPMPQCNDTVTCGATDIVYPGANYIASVYDPVGRYSFQSNQLGTVTNNPPLQASASTETAGNGVYAYHTQGAAKVFPDQSHLATNYGVDVVFQAANCVNGQLPLDVSLCPSLQTTTTTTTEAPTTTTTNPLIYDPTRDGPIPPKTCFWVSNGVVECQEYIKMEDPSKITPTPLGPATTSTTTSESSTSTTVPTTQPGAPQAPQTLPPSTPPSGPTTSYTVPTTPTTK